MSWRRFFRRKRADADLEQEIDFYPCRGDRRKRRSRHVCRAKRRRQARLKFGNPRQVRESVWQQNTVSLIDNAWRDLKYAARTLTRSPGFALVAVLVMALGIGANIALLTVVRSVLLNPLPYRDSARLYALYQRNSHDRKRSDAMPAPEYLPVDAGSFAEWQKVGGGHGATRVRLAVAGIQRFVGGRKASRTDRSRVVLVEFLFYAGSNAGHRAKLYGGRRPARRRGYGHPLLGFLEAAI